MIMEKKFKWKLLTNSLGVPVKTLNKVVAVNHPLESGGSITCKYLDSNYHQPEILSKNQTLLDPLGFLTLEGSDPLTAATLTDPLSLSVDENEGRRLQTSRSEDVLEEVCESESDWENLMSEFCKFNTKQRLSLSTVLYTTEGGLFKNPLNIDKTKGTNRSCADRVKARLEHFDDLDKSRSTEKRSSGGSVGSYSHGWTTEEFSLHMMDLREQMKEAWNEDQRIKALKIAIQVVKVLGLSPPEIFYPAKFSYCTALLDTIGHLVVSRINNLFKSTHSANYYSGKEEALETVQNWFHKVVSMREILPRIYLEAALFSSFEFLPKESREGALLRLIRMCRGLGDPIVAAFARLYVIRCGLKHRRSEKEHIRTAVEDTVLSMNWGWNGAALEDIDTELEDFDRSGMVIERVFCPVLQWMFKHMSTSSGEVEHVFRICQQSKGLIQYILLKSVLKAFPPHQLHPHCLALVQILDDSLAQGESPYECLISVSNVVVGRSLSEEERIEVLKTIWSIIQRLRSLEGYLRALGAWIPFVAQFFTIKEVDKILSDVLKRMSKHSQSQGMTSSSQGVRSLNVFPHLLSLLNSTISSFRPSADLYSLTSFRGLLNLFRREGGSNIGLGSISEMKKLLEVVLEHHQEEFSDAETISVLLSVFGSLQTGINALTTTDEVRQVNQLVNTFVRRVAFGSDLERLLDFYVEARAVFSGLDLVLEALVQHVLRIQMTAMKIVKGHHTARTAAFERACTAYCFISIPSLACPLVRFNLYVATAAVAMVNNCMGQGDACVKSAINTVVDIAADVQDGLITSEVVSWSVISAVGYLVAIPDPPEGSKPLYLFRGLYNGLKILAEVMDKAPLCRGFLALFRAICTVAQDKIPYRFQNVDGLDVLYGGSNALKMEAESLASDALFNILSLLGNNDPGSRIDKAEAVHLVTSLVGAAVTFGDMTDPDVKAVTSILMKLLDKHGVQSTVKESFEKKFALKCSETKC